MVCIHCGRITQKDSEKFCCNGCESAYLLINENGFGEYYAQREIRNYQNIKPDIIYSSPDITDFITFDGKNYFINLIVEGIHCASCVWLIESLLIKEKNVVSARINMTTKRLKLTWYGDKERINELVEYISKTGYKLIPFNPNLLSNFSNDKLNELLKCLAVAGFGAGNLMLISISLWSSNNEMMGNETRNLLHWISAIFGLPITIYSGMPFFKSAFLSLKNKRANMDIPITVAVILTAFMSLIETIYRGHYIYFESSVMLLFFLLIGRYLDLKARSKARSAAQELLTLMSGVASVLGRDNIIKFVPYNKLESGMILFIAIGEKIPADGKIIEGETEIDTSIITGETLPKKMIINDKVFAGMVNISEPIKIKIEEVGDNTILAEVIKLIEKAEEIKTSFVDISEKISRFYTPIIHLIALLTFLGWFYIYEVQWQEALLYAVTVLIITCPCALALAVPIVHVLANYRLFKMGILVKNNDVLEKIHKLKHIIFDKTGTITKGKPNLLNIENYPNNILQMAASISANSKHPLARAITNIYNGPLLNLETQEVTGKGLKSVWNNTELKLGNAEFCGIEDGSYSLYFRYGEKVINFDIQDELREDAKEVIDALKADYEIYLYSGDILDIVEKYANILEIKNYKSGCFPKDKMEKIKNLQKSDITMMIGDGINDAPSLALADISISPANAADISQITADILFQGEKLRPVIEVIKVGKLTRKLILQNISVALLYNIVAIPAAICGFITPLIAALAMSSSSVIVTLNSLRMNKK